MNLWLARHAQPLVEAGVCYGATDMAADDGATRICAAALAQAVPGSAQVWSSPLRRCAQLAADLQELRPDLRYRADPRLVEMDFGCWEGVPWNDIPKSAIDAWTAEFWRCRFGGQDNVAGLMGRVASAWLDARQQPGAVVWITHAGVIRAATLLSQGVTQLGRADQWPAAGPGFGAWVHL